MFCRIDDNYQIHYEILEDVLPRDTLFVHGNIASNRWWYPTLEVLRGRDSQAKGRAILVEFRGCGKSTAPKTVEDAKMSIFRDDILQIIKNLNLQKFDLVGHSTGGFIIAMVAAALPEKVCRLVALDPVGAKGIKFDPSLETAFEAMKNDRELTATVIGSTIYNNDPNSRYFQQVIVEDAFHAAKTVGLYVLKNLDPIDISEDLKKIDCQALFLHGEHDVLLPIEDTKKMAELCKHGQFAKIMGHGHCANIENPQRFAEILTDFLQ